MDFKSEMKGFDEVKSDLDNLAKHPEQFFKGQTFETQQEVECSHCGEKFPITVPVRIQRVVGNKGIGPGFSTKQECPVCGELNQYEWAETVATIEITS